MKKTIIKIFALSLVAVMLCLALASCDGPSGTYGGEMYTLEFSGSNVKISWKGVLDRYEMSGKFEVAENDEGQKSITITFDETDGGYADDVIYAAPKGLFGGTNRYNSGNDDKGDYIEIGPLRFYKK